MDSDVPEIMFMLQRLLCRYVYTLRDILLAQTRTQLAKFLIVLCYLGNISPVFAAL